MTADLNDTSILALQEQLLEEIDARQRLQEELKLALRAQKDLRLENDFLRLHLRGKHPGRIKDVATVLKQLDAGVEVVDVVDDDRRILRRTASRSRKAIGRMPGVRKVYHGLKKLAK